MIKLLVIADDLTGALDTGVQMAKRGSPTLVTLAGELTGIPQHIRVLVADTESRHISAGEAGRRVRRLAEAARAIGIPHIYKKTDSTLRGNVGAELSAMVAGTGESVQFAPAFPRMRRTTVGGVQFVDGVPLAATDFARDPVDPVRHSAVADILARQCGLPVINCPVDGYEQAAAKPDRRQAIYVFDTETQEHLRSLAGMLRRCGRSRYLAGCAGFAEELPDLLGLGAAPPPGTAGERGRVLAVCGSVNQRSLDQVNHARLAGCPVFALTGEQKLTAGYADTAEGADFARRIGAALEKVGSAIVCAALDRDNLIPAEGDAYQTIAANIGGIAGRILNEAEVRNLVVLGGDTLLSVAKAAGGTGFLPLAEPLPGVVEALMNRGKSGDLRVFTKAGGFGGPAALTKILESLL